MNYKHLELSKEPQIDPRFKKQMKYDPFAGLIHGDMSNKAPHLIEQLEEAKRVQEGKLGYDDRYLLKIKSPKAPAMRVRNKLSQISGFNVISEEDDNIIIGLASKEAIDEIKQKYTDLLDGHELNKTDANTFKVIEEFCQWTSTDREGALLRSFPPTEENFIVDVELWSIWEEINLDSHKNMMEKFKSFLIERNIQIIDKLENFPSLLLYRVRINNNTLTFLLNNYRDIRKVDLPPKYKFDNNSITFDIANEAKIIPPNTDSPVVCILDSGVNSNHPLLQQAIGDRQSFIPNNYNPDDESGHGTAVAGFALYHDITTAIDNGTTFIQSIRILSGRILDSANEYNHGYILNAIEEAVDYFTKLYGCKIFNLSIGDSRLTYQGKHLEPLAFGVDCLARKYKVLFIISTGNYSPHKDVDGDLINNFPAYLLCDGAKIIDPATALNAITVGSIARHTERANISYGLPNSIDSIPISQHNWPSPFSRTGGTINGAIKPDFVEFGGNYCVDRNGNHLHTNKLPELILGNNIQRPFSTDTGTSYAAPKITNLAARILTEIPDASNDLLRALLAINAEYPPEYEEFEKRLNSNNIKNPSHLFYGYGTINQNHLFRSSENATILYATDSIEDGTNHYYEIALPEEFYTGKYRRKMEISVALAYTPEVRRTRLQYTKTKLAFVLHLDRELNNVRKQYEEELDENRKKIDKKKPPENMSGKRKITQTDRSKGTLQCSDYIFKQIYRNLQDLKIYVVITCNDHEWSDVKYVPEPYALSIRFTDHENADAKIYTALKQKIELKQRSRQRVNSFDHSS